MFENTEFPLPQSCPKVDSEKHLPLTSLSTRSPKLMKMKQVMSSKSSARVSQGRVPLPQGFIRNLRIQSLSPHGRTYSLKPLTLLRPGTIHGNAKPTYIFYIGMRRETKPQRTFHSHPERQEWWPCSVGRKPSPIRFRTEGSHAWLPCHRRLTWLRPLCGIDGHLPERQGRSLGQRQR